MHIPPDARTGVVVVYTLCTPARTAVAGPPRPTKRRRRRRRQRRRRRRRVSEIGSVSCRRSLAGYDARTHTRRATFTQRFLSPDRRPVPVCPSVGHGFLTCEQAAALPQPQHTTAAHRAHKHAHCTHSVVYSVYGTYHPCSVRSTTPIIRTVPEYIIFSIIFFF